ncbi:MAG TPA: Fic family protein [Ktedonobacteraceae bacterium]|jgi:Fic family protein|nr:Fic family protein [Ktedonobacteraceae bacterium]
MPRKQDRPHLDPRLAERIKRKKAELDRHRPLPVDTVRRLNEDLRVFLTYHSNAIEGNSLTLHETQMVIDYGITVHGHPLREYLEATNHAEAYSYVTMLVEKRERISIETILKLHSLVMDKILEGKGRFRTVPVYIRGSNMTPPPAYQVEGLMKEWVRWIYGEGLQYDPVVRSAIAHHGFEAVHPFEDGNGRVGRLLLNLMLMQEGYPPALLLNDWRARYIHGLNTANTGNYGPLLNLIGRSVESGLDLYLEACAAVPGYQPLRELVDASGYSLEYISWLARNGRIDAVKRNGRWYSTPEAIEQYKSEVEQGKQQRGRPPS